MAVEDVPWEFLEPWTSSSSDDETMSDGELRQSLLNAAVKVKLEEGTEQVKLEVKEEGTEQDPAVA